MFSVILKNGEVRKFEQEISGYELAKSISKTLERDAVLCSINGKICDLSTTLTNGANVEVLTLQSPNALEVLRHSTAHTMSCAVKALFPSVKFAVGPATEDGFFFDFLSETAFTPEILEKIEKKMHELVAQNIPFERITMKRDEASKFFKNLGEKYKVELLEGIEDSEVSVYKLGETYDLCRGPHLPSTKFVGSAFKLIKASGAYWKGDKDKDPLQRIYGTVWLSKADLDAYFLRIEEAAKRDHRKIGLDLDLFHLMDIAPGTVFWHTQGWTVSRLLKSFVRRRIE
jgi:threonyl-tRNA synthetase